VITLAIEGYRVLLVDTDAHGHLAAGR